MSIISLIVTLAVLGFLVWLILQIPMPQQIKNVIIGVFVLVVVLWLLQQLGVIHGFRGIKL